MLLGQLEGSAALPVPPHSIHRHLPATRLPLSPALTHFLTTTVSSPPPVCPPACATVVKDCPGHITVEVGNLVTITLGKSPETSRMAAFHEIAAPLAQVRNSTPPPSLPSTHGPSHPTAAGGSVVRVRPRRAPARDSSGAVQTWDDGALA